MWTSFFLRRIFFYATACSTFLISSCTSAKLETSYLASGSIRDHSKIHPLNSLLPEYRSTRSYFALLGNNLFFIGKLNIENNYQFMLRQVNNASELNRLVALFRKLKNSNIENEPESNLTAFNDHFKRVELSNNNEQSILVSTLRELTQGDGRERGCFLKLKQEPDCFKLYLEQSFNVGSKNEVQFRFPKDESGRIAITQKDGEVLVGTVHTHTHDQGLSGLSQEEQLEGKGDASNVITTQVPWIVIGPSQIQGGYLNKYGRLVIENIDGVDLAVYAWFRLAVKI